MKGSKSNPNILILKFPYSSAWGGGEWHTITLVNELKKRGINFYLVSSCPILLEEFEKRGWPTKKVWAGVEPVTGTAVFLFPFLAPFVFLRLAYLLLNYKISKKINIIYCLSLTEKLLLAWWAKFLGMKVIWIEHLQIERWLIKNPYKFLYLLNSRYAHVIGVAQAIKKQLLDLGVNKKNAQVIYNGVDLQKFKSKNEKLKMNEKLKTVKEKIIVGTVARLAKEKGIDYLIQAIPEVLKRFPQTEFWIVGQGAEEKNLKTLARNLGLLPKIKFLGFQKDIIKVLLELDIFVLIPFRRDSFGLAAAEAMACEIPVIVSNIAGLPEVVENGKSGLVIPAQSPKALAQALSQLLADKNLRRKMGKQARQRIEEKFPQEKMIENFYQLFLDK